VVSRGILGTPYAGALGLLIWTIDHWPYINGKAVVEGVELLELGSVRLLDVLHYYFEVDHQMASAEEAESKSNIRSALYQNFYNTTYKYQYKSSDKGYNYNSATTANGQPLMDGYAATDVDDPLNEKEQTKPFVPPTEFNPDSPNPFGGALDPPAG
jgi:hypothetical protein